MRRTRWLLTALSLSIASGCDATPAPAESGLDAGGSVEADAAMSPDAAPIIMPGSRMIGTAERPARLVVPPAHDGTTALPVVVVLHGYGSTGVLFGAYLGATALGRELGYYLILPDGTLDVDGQRYWSAGACCEFGATEVDDVAYLSSLLDEAQGLVPVDTGRVYFIGYSNGGFMTYHMACSLADRVTAVAVLAGTEADLEPCEPTRPVSVLHLHGTEDMSILYPGGSLGTLGTGPGRYLSADEEVAAWVMRNSCEATVTDGGTFDYDGEAPDAETTVTTHASCARGTVVEQWRMEGSDHDPAFFSAADDGRRAIFEWLLARRTM